MSFIRRAINAFRGDMAEDNPLDTKDKFDDSFTEHHAPGKQCEHCQPHNRLHRAHSVSPNGFIIIHRPWREIMGKRRKKVDAEAWLRNFIKEFGQPTLITVTQKGITVLYLRDFRGRMRRWNDLGQYQIRIMREDIDGSEVALPNMSKRLSTWTRPTPIAVTWDRVEYVECRLITDKETGATIGFEPVRAVVREPGKLVVGILPKGVGLDGCVTLSRYIIVEAIDNLYIQMAGGLTEESIKLIEDKAERKAAATQLEKAKRVQKRLMKTGIWNIRLTGANYKNLGGLIKGDAMLTKRGALEFGLDVLTSLDNLKPEEFTSDGTTMLVAGQVHDSRTIRWIDRQSIGHHMGWLFYGHVQRALRRMNEEVLDSTFRKGDLAQFIKFQEKSIDQELAEDTINAYEARYRALIAADVLTYSIAAVSGICRRWLDKLKPVEKVGGDGNTYLVQDTRKMPIPASEFRSVKPLAQLKLAGWAGMHQNIPDWHWSSRDGLCVVMNDMTFLWTAKISGGADQDDHWRLNHLRAKSDCNILMPNGDTLSVKAGELVTVFMRLPLGISSNAVLNEETGELEGELASEYIILKPTVLEAEKLVDRHGKFPMVDLSLRIKRIDELEYPPCPSECTNKDAHEWGHPTWELSDVEYTDKVYTMDVVLKQFNAQMEAYATGAVGARANLELFCMAHGILFPWRCHTETWVDLFTKATPAVGDIKAWAAFNKADLELVAAASKKKPLDVVAFRRIGFAFRGRSIPTANEGVYAEFASDHRDFEADFNQKSKAEEGLVKAKMIRLLSDVVIPPERMVPARTRSGSYPRLLEYILYTDKKLRNERAAAGEEFTPADYDLVANKAVRMLDKQGLSWDEKKREVKENLAFSYRVGRTDHVFLNGELLEITIAVLVDLKNADLGGSSSSDTASDDRWEDDPE